jgi:hypothetical protein
VIARERNLDKNVQKRHSLVADSLAGIIFLGTPHNGSKFTPAAKTISHFTSWLGSSSELLDFLDPDSPAARDLEGSFFVSYPSISRVDFCESFPPSLWGFRLPLVSVTILQFGICV